MSWPSHAAARRAFRWEDTLRALGWTSDGRVDLARTIVERHAGSGRAALRWIGKTGAARTLGFHELARLSAQVAGWLRSRGLREGDRVAGFLPRVPETLAIMLGTWKAGGVYVPIFTGFGRDAIAFRLRDSGAKVLCTHSEYRSRVPAPMPEGVAILTISASDEPSSGEGAAARVGGDADFHEAIASQLASAQPSERRRDDPAVILYTSGSTGPPKGVQIAANFLAAVHPWLIYGVDLRADDVFWPTGDPGWGYGLICYMLALAMGVPVMCHEAAPSPEYALRRLHEDGVTNLATTPTLLRGIMALPAESLRRWPVRLRAASSCGEPLNAEVVTFFRRHWGVTVMDHYGSSEFGLPVGNCGALDMEVRPGSMGLPLPGSTMAIIGDDGHEVASDTVGHIGMRPNPEGYYSLGYWGDVERTAAMSRGGWLTCGDLGRRDADGYFWFEGRADDVIKSAGYRIGPFEVESAILGHPAVAEAAVVGVPDALRGQIVKAFVVLRAGHAASPALREEIVELVRTRVGRHQYPREIEFVPALPKTETGKIQRFLLRATTPTSA
jgi:acetyl-CoA synthetase